MQINRIDHLVLTIANIERTVEFYHRVLGMQRIEFAGGKDNGAPGIPSQLLRRLPDRPGWAQRRSCVPPGRVA